VNNGPTSETIAKTERRTEKQRNEARGPDHDYGTGRDARRTKEDDVPSGSECHCGKEITDGQLFTAWEKGYEHASCQVLRTITPGRLEEIARSVMRPAPVPTPIRRIGS
jgi:hypothetical protein